MTNALRTAIADLATTFATAVAAAIKGASLDDILTLADAATPARRGPGRPRGAAAARTRVVSNPAAKPSAPAAPAPAKKTPVLTTATKGGRIARRSPEDVEKTLELIVALLKSTKDGLRSEQIQKHLGVRKEELPRVLKQGLTTKALESKGQKRSTVYRAA